MDELEYLHRFSIAEQLAMESTKIEVKYPNTDKYTTSQWFAALASEFGEVASNINEQEKEDSKYEDDALQENLEYELLQMIALSLMWLRRLRGEQK